MSLLYTQHLTLEEARARLAVLERRLAAARAVATPTTLGPVHQLRYEAEVVAARVRLLAEVLTPAEVERHYAELERRGLRPVRMPA